jgi:uncharacterized protein
LRYAYLHGFASGPRSYKGTLLRQRLAGVGIHLELPDLARPSFAKLTYTDALTAIDDLGQGPFSFIGSSMGGYLAARWAGQNPDRVGRLLLLCPGFDLVTRWPLLVGAESMARWSSEGALMLPDRDGGQTAVHYGFIEDARRHPAFPSVTCPTVIVHGVRDEVVPVESSRVYARTHEAQLVEVDDDHGLAASVDRIEELALRHFGFGP